MSFKNGFDELVDIEVGYAASGLRLARLQSARDLARRVVFLLSTYFKLTFFRIQIF